MATPAAVLAIVLEANTAAAQAGLAQTQGSLERTAASAKLAGTAMESSAAKAGAAWSAAGKKMTAAGKSITRHVSLPAAAAGAASVKMAIDFEDSMSHIRNLVGASQKQVDDWGKQILALSPKLGKSPKELADALYFITSSGIKASKALSVLKVTAKASAIGLGDTQTVADAVTSAMNAYAKSGLSAARATNILADAVKLGKGEPEDLAASIGRVIPIASKLGVPFHDVAAAIASMTLQGLDAAEATTALRGIMSATFKPTKAAEGVLKGVGLSAAALRKSLDQDGTLETLQMLSDKLHGNVEAMGAVFPNIRGLVGAFNLTGDSAKKNAEIFDEMAKKTNTVQVGFQHLSKTDAFKLHQALAGLQAAAVKVGTALLPVVSDLADMVASIAQGFSSMPKFARDFLLGAIVVGPIVRFAGAFSTIVGKILTLGGLGGKVGGSVGGVLTQRGATPANPLFVEVINQGPGGAGPGGPVPTGNNREPTTRLGKLGKYLGFGASAIPIVGTAALGYYLASKQPANNPATLPGTSTQGGPMQWLKSSPLGQLWDFINQPAPALGSRGPGAPTVAGHPMDPEKQMAHLRVEVQQLAEAGKKVPIDLIHRAGLDPKQLKDAGVAIRSYDRFLGGAGAHLHRFGTEGHKSADDIRKWSQDVQAMFGKVSDKIRTFGHKSVDGIHEFGIAGQKNKSDIEQWSKDVRNEFDRVIAKNKKFSDQTDKTKQQVSESTAKQAQNVLRSYDNMQAGVGIGLGKLQDMTNSALKALGLNKPVQFRTSAGAPTGAGGAGHPVGRRKGGSIVPGQGSGDKVPAMLEPGEFVLNREAVKGIGAARLQAMNKAIPRFAKGGFVPVMHHYPHLTGDTDFLPALGKALSAFAAATVGTINVNSGGRSTAEQAALFAANPNPMLVARPGTSHHELGIAADIAPAPHGSEGRFGLTYPMSWEPWHIELAGGSKGALGKAGAVWKNIKRVILNQIGGAGRGPWKDTGQASLDKVWKQANAYGRKKAGSIGGFGDIKAGSVEALAKKMVLATWGAGQWPPFSSLEMGEAGWDVHAQNPTSSAYGLAQNINPSTYPPAGRPGSTAPLMDQARAQLSWMIHYIKGRYGTPAAAWGAWQSRSPHWYQEGGAVPSFGGGGIVPGPRGHAQPIVAHGGERVVRENEKVRYQITITNWRDGTGYMEEIADGAVNGERRLGNQMARMRRA